MFSTVKVKAGSYNIFDGPQVVGQIEKINEKAWMVDTVVTLGISNEIVKTLKDAEDLVNNSRHTF